MFDTPFPCSYRRYWPGADEAARLFWLCFGQDRGWVEIATIIGDPDDRARCRFRRTFFPYAPERMDGLLRQVSWYYQANGNVYFSVNLYSKGARPSQERKCADADEESSIPRDGRVIFVDDAREGEYTFRIRTGTNAPQGILLLQAPAPAEVRASLAARAAIASRGDMSGADILQLGRVPGTLNTKRRHGGQYRGATWVPGTGFPIHLEPDSGRRYDLAELDARLPALPAPRSQSPRTSHRAQAADDDLWEASERLLPLVARLLTSPRLRKATAKPDSQLARVLRGERVTIWTKSDVPDSTDSAQRAVLVDKLVYFGLPDEEILALLRASPWWDGADAKGTTWAEKEAERLLRVSRAKYPAKQPEPTRLLGADPRSPAGSPNAYFDWLTQQQTGRDRDGEPCVILTPEEAADELGVDVRLVLQLERELLGRGWIKRKSFGPNRGSWIALQRVEGPPGGSPGDGNAVAVPQGGNFTTR